MAKNADEREKKESFIDRWNRMEQSVELGEMVTVYN